MHNAVSASLSPYGTDTFLIWNHFSHHQSLRPISFIPLSPVTYSVTQAATSQIYANNRSILSTANSTANCPCVWLKLASQSELSYFLDGSKNRFNSLKKVDRLSQVLKIGAALSHIYNLHYKIT